MIINEKNDKNIKYWDEVIYIQNNYYLLKKRPHAKVHSLVNTYISYIVILSILAIISIIVQEIIFVVALCLILLIIYIYSLVETKYKIREYLKQEDLTTKIDETGVEVSEKNKMTTKLYWDNIEWIIINKHTISFLPKSFAHFIITININHKNKVYQALKKYQKLNILQDNSQH